MFSFKLKNQQGQEQGWYIDLKEKGAVGKGEAPEGKKADGTYTGWIWELSTNVIPPGQADIPVHR